MEKSNNLLKSVFGILLIIFLSVNVFSQSGWVRQYSGTNNLLRNVTFMDENTGFILNDPFLKTSNGGINWVPFPVLPPVSWVNWIDVNTGYGPGNTVYKTTNGGLNWTDLNQTNFYQISFADGLTGYGCGNTIFFLDYAELRMFKTTDGGVNWNSVWLYTLTINPLEMISFGSIETINSQVMYFSVYYENDEFIPYVRWSRIYKTNNGGSGWLQSITIDSLALYGLVFPNANTGYAIGKTLPPEPPSPKYYLFRCVNDIWSVVLSLDNYITTLCFPDGATGYVVENAHIIHKTTNGGQNWTIQSPGTSINLRNINFVNSQTGYIVGDSGLILKTTTGGEAPVFYSVSGTVRYQDNNQPVTSGYVKALMYDEQTQNVITVDSTGINSNGTYMLPQCPPIELDIMAYENDEEDAAFVPTYYVSTIYWENATHITPDTNLSNIDIGVYRINNTVENKHIGGKVYKANEDNTAVLKDAIVYARIGNQFKGYSITGSSGSYQIDSLSAGTYEILANRMGFYSAVRPFQLTTFSVDTIDFVLNNLLVSIEPNSGNVPEKYWLSQNYPNPFNPQTKIKFGLPEQTHVKLVLYDLLGREISVLVNDVLKAGEYNVTWNASSLSSGIYFYRIETDKYTETRKLVFVK